jgi:hypothetical protein
MMDRCAARCSRLMGVTALVKKTSASRRDESTHAMPGARSANVDATSDADTKLIASWLVGSRDAGSAYELMQDVAGRLRG